MNLSDTSLQYIHDLDITNDKESTEKLNLIMKNEVLIKQKTLNFYGLSIFSTGALAISFLVENQAQKITILSVVVATTLLGLYQKYKASSLKKNIPFDKNTIIKEHLLRMKNKHQSNLYTILVDLFSYNLLPDEELQLLKTRVKNNAVDIVDIQKIYQALLSAKLKNTPLPSTTISLAEHQKHISEENT